MSTTDPEQIYEFFPIFIFVSSPLLFLTEDEIIAPTPTSTFFEICTFEPIVDLPPNKQLSFIITSCNIVTDVPIIHCFPIIVFGEF